MARKTEQQRAFTDTLETIQPSAMPSGMVSPPSTDTSAAYAISTFGKMGIEAYKGKQLAKLEGTREQEASIFKPYDTSEEPEEEQDISLQEQAMQELSADRLHITKDFVSAFDKPKDTFNPADLLQPNFAKIARARAQGKMSDAEAQALVNMAVREASARSPGLAPEFRQAAATYFGKYGTAAGLLEPTAREKEVDQHRKDVIAFAGEFTPEAEAKYMVFKHWESTEKAKTAEVNAKSKIGTLTIQDMDGMFDLQMAPFYNKYQVEIKRLATLQPGTKETELALTQSRQTAEVVKNQILSNYSAMLANLKATNPLITTEVVTSSLKKKSEELDVLIGGFKDLDEVKAYSKRLEIGPKEAAALGASIDTNPNYRALYTMKRLGVISEKTVLDYMLKNLGNKKIIDSRPELKALANVFNSKDFKDAIDLATPAGPELPPSVADVQKVSGNDKAIFHKAMLEAGTKAHLAATEVGKPISKEEHTKFYNKLTVYLDSISMKDRASQNELVRLLRTPGFEKAVSNLGSYADEVRSKMSLKYDKTLFDSEYGLVPRLIKNSSKANALLDFNETTKQFEYKLAPGIDIFGLGSTKSELEADLKSINDLLSVSKYISKDLEKSVKDRIDKMRGSIGLSEGMAVEMEPEASLDTLKLAASKTTDKNLIELRIEYGDYVIQQQEQGNKTIDFKEWLKERQKELEKSKIG